MSKTVNNVKKTAIRDKSGKFKRGNPGRPKGAKDKITRTAKENIEKAVKELGGYEGILKWAKKNFHNQGLLYGWYFKMLPTNVTAELTGKDGEALKITYVQAKESGESKEKK
ncbi:MAG TPA: hypothetical protein VMW42_01435 [Desulfatiglandales bacterium]|nr:hypothetical protein [Desulfatiglandales bacterium]